MSEIYGSKSSYPRKRDPNLHCLFENRKWNGSGTGVIIYKGVTKNE